MSSTLPISPRHVGALAGERQLVLHQHLDLPEARVDEVGRDRLQAALPGPHLGRGRAIAELVAELF